MDWENSLDQKNENSTNQIEMAACEQNITNERTNFVQAPFSHFSLKLERKKFTPQNQSLFGSISCFGVAKVTIQFDFKNHESV